MSIVAGSETIDSRPTGALLRAYLLIVGAAARIAAFRFRRAAARRQRDVSVGRKPSLFSFVWQRSWKDQICLALLVVAGLPLGYMLYEIPKEIINRAIGSFDPLVAALRFGMPLTGDFSQEGFLIALCLEFLAVGVLCSLSKFCVGLYKGRLTERLLVDLRRGIFDRVQNAEPGRKQNRDRIVYLITGQAQQVAAFAGSAIFDPVSLAGQIIVATGFIVVQDARLGAWCIALQIGQASVAMQLNKRVRAAAEQRLLATLEMSADTGEAMASGREAGAADQELDFLSSVAAVRRTGCKLVLWKCTARLTSNLCCRVLPFFLYLYGGYLVIEGELTLGSLVAVIAAQKEMAGSWKEGLDWLMFRAETALRFGYAMEGDFGEVSAK